MNLDSDHLNFHQTIKTHCHSQLWNLAYSSLINVSRGLFQVALRRESSSISKVLAPANLVYLLLQFKKSYLCTIR